MMIMRAAGSKIWIINIHELRKNYSQKIENYVSNNSLQKGSTTVASQNWVQDFPVGMLNAAENLLACGPRLRAIPARISKIECRL